MTALVGVRAAKFLYLSLVLAVCGCGEPPMPPKLQGGGAPPLVSPVVSDSAPKQASPPALSSDLSKTVAEYESLGLPSLGAAWPPDKYQQAAQVLVDVANEQRSSLPRLNSSKSASVIRKFTQPETFYSSEPAANGAGDLPLTPERARAYLKPVGSLIAVYAPADETGENFAPEQVELTLATLLLLEPLVKDSSAPLTARQQFSAPMLAGALNMLSQRDMYSAALRRRLAAGVAEKIEPFAAGLATELRAQAQRKALALAEHEPDKAVKDSIHRIALGLEQPDVSVAHGAANSQVSKSERQAHRRQK